MAPEAPTLVVPVASDTSPLTPARPESADASDTSPLEDADEMPLAMYVEPPVVSVRLVPLVAPAVRLISVPRRSCVVPTSKETLPADPAVAEPVAIRISPESPEYALPVDKVISPLAPVGLLFIVTREITPLMA